MKLDAAPTVVVRNSALPFNRVVLMPIEPANVLPKPFVTDPVRESELVRDFAKPLLADSPKESEPPKVLESATWPVVLEDVVKDPINVLRSERCSVRDEAVVREPVSVLKTDECSARTEDKPSEPDKVLGKPLNSEPATDSELVNVRKSETRSVGIVEEPSEPVKNST